MKRIVHLFVFALFLFISVNAFSQNSIGDGIEEIKASPNPATDNSTISYEIAQEELIIFRLVNLIGETVDVRTIPSKKGANEISLDLIDLPSGLYIYSLAFKDQIYSKQLLVK